jgi:hypothetical protein
VPEECAAGRLPRSRRRGADAHPESQFGCSRSAHGAPLVGSAYDVRPTGLSAASAVASAARTPATPVVGAQVWVFVAPDACSASGASCPCGSGQTPGNDSDEAKFRKPTGLRSGLYHQRCLARGSEIRLRMRALPNHLQLVRAPRLKGLG